MSGCLEGWRDGEREIMLDVPVLIASLLQALLALIYIHIDLFGSLLPPGTVLES